MKNPKVGIVILNYNSYMDTLNLIDLIRDKLNYDNYEIIVVDNASPNESAEILEKEKDSKSYIFIANDKNSGYAAGNNIGIRSAIERGAKYSWILNNDILLPDPECLQKMVDLMEANEQIGVCNPIIMKPDETEDLQYPERPSVWGMSLGCLGYRKRRRSFVSNENFKIYRPHGCCMVLNNEIMQKISYMDERTFLYCEEDILAERLLKHNYLCWCCKDTYVIHNHSQTTYSAIKKKGIVKNTLKSYELYLREYREIKNPLLLHLILGIKGMIIYISY